LQPFQEKIHKLKINVKTPESLKKEGRRETEKQRNRERERERVSDWSASLLLSCFNIRSIFTSAVLRTLKLNEDDDKNEN